MNIVSILSFFLIYLCLIIASYRITNLDTILSYAFADTSKSCLESVSAFPPDPTTGCCGVEADPPNQIHDNNVTSITQYPWTVLIEFDRFGMLSTLCGGALISSKFVLSAAYCYRYTSPTFPKPKNVVLGEYDTRTEGLDCISMPGGGADCTQGITKIPIEKIILHPGFNQRQHLHNIALIRMEQAAPYTDFIRPICLPSVDMTLRTEPFTLIKAGWGDVLERSPVKLQVDLPYVSREVCQNIYTARTNGSRSYRLNEGDFCAGGVLGKDSCKGDGGLSLMFKNGNTFEAIGIVGIGFDPCGQENAPSIYTNVYIYKNWITSNIYS